MDATVIVDLHAFATESLQLFLEQRRSLRERAAPVGAQDPMPWQRRIATLRQQPRDHPRPSGQARTLGDLPVGGHFTARNRTDRGQDLLGSRQ